MGGKCTKHTAIKHHDNKVTCKYCGQEVEVVLKSYVEHLEERNAQLELLECRGVDNWSGYATLPDREDYDTEEEWDKAVERAMYSY